MTLAVLIAFTLSSTAWCLWIRRHAWRNPWQSATNTMILLMAAAIAATSPEATVTVGELLHGIVGQYHIEDWIGHMCFIGAANCLTYTALARLLPRDELQAAAKQFIERPAVVVEPVLLALLWQSDITDSKARIGGPIVDGWHLAYWLLLCGYLFYLLAFAARALRIVRHDPRHRATAQLFLWACRAGMAACVARIAVSIVPALSTDRDQLWTLICACVVIFAVAAGRSWRPRVRASAPSQQVQHTKRRRDDEATPAAG